MFPPVRIRFNWARRLILYTKGDRFETAYRNLNRIPDDEHRLTGLWIGCVRLCNEIGAQCDNLSE